MAGRFTDYVNFTSLSFLFFALYLYLTASQLYRIGYPSFQDTSGPTVDQYWEPEASFYTECYISPNATWNAKTDFEKATLIANFTPTPFSPTVLDTKTEVIQLTPETHTSVFAFLRQNQSVYLHVHATQNGYTPVPGHRHYRSLRTVANRIELIQFAPPHFSAEKHFLLDPSPSVTNDSTPSSTYVALWKPALKVRIVSDFTKFPYQEFPPLAYNYLRFEQPAQNKIVYLPPVFIDDLALTKSKLQKIDMDSTDSLTLELNLGMMTFARWQLMLTAATALSTAAGASDDMEMLRAMVSDTHWLLVVVTGVVSMLHVLFDWLAFKSDISFWRQKKAGDDMVGVSFRVLFINLVCEVVVLLYLMEEQTTLLILAPSFFSCLLLVWKLWKVHTASAASAQSDSLQKTHEVDKFATSHLLRILLPLVLGYAIYTLTYEAQKGWYSWVIQSLTSAVYALGFAMMTPQLIINYRLKSVAHLPWRYLIYRALNTFIDDLFAFVMPMPTMHRISCFRDDVVFVIYCYQRWIYPIDTERTDDEDYGKQKEE